MARQGELKRLHVIEKASGGDCQAGRGSGDPVAQWEADTKDR